MGWHLCAAVVVFCCAQAAAGAQHKVTPVESVIKLLEKLQKQSIEEGKAEAVAYDKFACFCKETADEKLYSVTTKGEKITLLTAEIKQLTEEITKLTQELSDLNEEADKLQKTIDAAEQTRSAEFNTYVQRAAEAQASVREAKDALDLLAAGKVPSMLQEKVGQPGVAAGSEFHSDELLEIMQDTLKKFKVNKNKLDAEETEKKHLHTMKQNARHNQLKGLKDNILLAEQESSTKEERKNMAEEDLTKTTELKNSDKQYMDDLTDECETKATAWDARSKSNAQELTAIAEALATLKGEVEGNYGANKKLVGLMTKGAKVGKAPAHGHWEWVPDGPVAAVAAAPKEEKEAPPAEAEADAETDDSEVSAEQADADADEGAEADADMDADSDTEEAAVEDGEAEEAASEEGEEEESTDVAFLQKSSSPRSKQFKKVVDFFDKQAQKLNSMHLSALVLKMKEDHFVKVRGMIKDLIVKLEEAANKEGDQKAWCDEEMSDATTMRDESIAGIEADLADLAMAKAKAEKLAEDIQGLTEEIAKLRKALNEATELRGVEKKNNAKTVADAESGLAGVTKAMKILNEFYAGAALVQTGSKKVGVVEQHKAQSKTHQVDAIMATLGVIKSDFEGTIDKVKTDESEADSEFTDFKTETESDIGQKEQDLEGKKTEEEQEKANVIDYKDNLKTHYVEKNDALKELAKLKPACVDTGSDHEEKAKLREQEIEALKNGYQILDSMR
jgi:hypothetical protein